MRKKSSKWSVGVQILDNHAKLAVVENTSKGIRIAHQKLVSFEAGSVQDGKIENESSVGQRLRAEVQELGLHDADTSMAVPTSSAVLRRSVYPALKDRELRNRIEVDLLAPEQLPFKDPVFDYIRLGAPRDEAAATAESGRPQGRTNEEEVLIFATPVEVVDSYTRVIELAGLQPRAVELTPLAVYRLLLRTIDSAGSAAIGRFMLVHAESDHADISIYENGIPVFMRQQMMPAHYMLDSELDRVGVFGRNLTIEISRILNYYKYSISNDQQDVQQLYLSSEHDWLSPLTEQVAGSFGGDVQPLALHNALMNYEAQHHAYAVSIGLAIKGA